MALTPEPPTKGLVMSNPRKHQIHIKPLAPSSRFYRETGSYCVIHKELEGDLLERWSNFTTMDKPQRDGESSTAENGPRRRERPGGSRSQGQPRSANRRAGTAPGNLPGNAIPGEISPSSLRSRSMATEKLCPL